MKTPRISGSFQSSSLSASAAWWMRPWGIALRNEMMPVSCLHTERLCSVASALHLILWYIARELRVDSAMLGLRHGGSGRCCQPMK